ICIVPDGRSLDMAGVYVSGNTGPTDSAIQNAGTAHLHSLNLINTRAVSNSLPWAALEDIALAGQIRTNDGGKWYTCTVPGTTGNSGGPTGTGASISDGSVTWKYVVTGDANEARIIAGSSFEAGGKGSTLVENTVFTSNSTQLNGVPVYDGSQNF